MDTSIFKYSLLGPFERKEVEDFIDFLFNKTSRKDATKLSDYKQRILDVSTWNDQDIQAMEEHAKRFNRWDQQTW